MMNEEEALLKIVLDNPDDDAPRLAYADWCERQNDEATSERAEFIRVQLKLAAPDMAADPFIRMVLRDDERPLLRRHHRAWAGRMATLVEDYAFDRGFVELVTLTARDFLILAPLISALAPVRHLDLSGVREVAAELFASTHLEGIRSLRLNRCGLDDADLRLLAASPHLTELRWLSLADNRIGLDGAEALAAASHNFPRLVFVNFSGNPVDPTEQYAHDNGFIVERWLPESGLALEARYGFLPWLHVEAKTVDVTPDRFRVGT